VREIWLNQKKYIETLFNHFNMQYLKPIKVPIQMGETLVVEQYWGQGKTQGSTLTVHQQALTIGPFSNTYRSDTVSPEVAIGGCRTYVSTTRGNAKWNQGNNTQRYIYRLSHLNLLHKLYVRSITTIHQQYNRGQITQH
jgi:hypothetical protein